MSNLLTHAGSQISLVFLLFLLASCNLAKVQQINLDELNLEELQEKLNLEELYTGETIHDIAILKEADGLPPVDIIFADGYFKYTDPEETFSLIFDTFPWEKDQEFLGTFEIERSLYAGLSNSTVAYMFYLKSEDPTQFTKEFIDNLADLMVNPDMFGPHHEVFTFNTNDVEGLEYRFSFQDPDEPDVKAYARVRVVVNEEYLYLYRLGGVEEKIFGVEADKFFGSFALLSN